MEKLCASSVLLLLLASMHTGSARQCYESQCFNDISINSCLHNNKTVLKECNIAIFRNNLNKLQGAGGSPSTIPNSVASWACVKYEATGMQNGLPAELELKMCYPDVSDACSQVQSAAKGVEFPLGDQAKRECSKCDGDACNPAHRPTASSLGALLSTVVASLGVVLLRR